MSSIKKIPTRRLGANGPEVSAVGLGAMSIGAFYGKTDDAAASKALTHAANRGMTFWDTADVYGTSETSLARWFKETGRRSDIFLATKFGAWDPEGKVNNGQPVSTPSYIKYALKRSLKDLETPYIDLYYQHRVYPNVPIEVVLETLRPAVENGTIRWLGLSECTVETLRRAKAVKGLGEKIVAVQMELSPFELEVEKSGFAKAAQEMGVRTIAYSPLGRAMISGKYRSPADFEEGDFRKTLPRFSAENFPKNVELADNMKAIADKHNATPSQIALAWILAESPNYIPIPGCRSAERIEENAGGAEIQLAPKDVRAIRALVENADVRGTRYQTEFIGSTEGNCIPLNAWKGEA